MRNEKVLLGQEGGSSCEALPTPSSLMIYLQRVIDSHSFHFMAQTPDHKSFTSPTTETVPGLERLPHKGPHSSFLHPVTEM